MFPRTPLPSGRLGNGLNEEEKSNTRAISLQFNPQKKIIFNAPSAFPLKICT
jgi:hypothetical protein